MSLSAPSALSASDRLRMNCLLTNSGYLDRWSVKTSGPVPEVKPLLILAQLSSQSQYSMVPDASPPAVAAAAPPTVTEAELPESLLLPQAVRISARAAVPAIHADLTARVLVIGVRSFLGALRPGRADRP